jgi:hydroxyacylglutathione hydrolase
LIGIDRISGYFDADLLAGQQRIEQITARDLAQRLQAVTVVDVRSANEWATGQIPGAIHIPLGYLDDHASQLTAGRPIVVQCQSGGRSSIAASILERRGVRGVVNLSGGITAWSAAGQPIEGAVP